jgi:hypothetical protein
MPLLPLPRSPPKEKISFTYLPNWSSQSNGQQSTGRATWLLCSSTDWKSSCRWCVRLHFMGPSYHPVRPWCFGQVNHGSIGASRYVSLTSHPGMRASRRSSVRMETTVATNHLTLAFPMKSPADAKAVTERLLPASAKVLQGPRCDRHRALTAPIQELPSRDQGSSRRRRRWRRRGKAGARPTKLTGLTTFVTTKAAAYCSSRASPPSSSSPA